MPSTSPTPATTVSARQVLVTTDQSAPKKSDPVKTAKKDTTATKTGTNNTSANTGSAKKVVVDKVRAKWEQATFGKSLQSVTLEELVKNLTSPVQEVRRASAERLQYCKPEELRAISKLLLSVASTDSDTWTATYAYRAYLQQLKEKELKIHPDN